jgi:hypothetical protein
VLDSKPACTQALHVAGGTHFVGVNFGAMDKYRQPLTAEQWRHCVASLKVLHISFMPLGS